MDKIYEIDQKPWISSNYIHLKDRLEAIEDLLKSNNLRLNINELAKTQHEQDLVEALDSFAKSSEEKVKPYFLFNSTDQKTLTEDDRCQLETFKLQLEHAKRMISDGAYRLDYLLQLKTTRREFLMRQLAKMNRTTDETAPSETQPPDGSLMAIVVVQIWKQPTKATKVHLEKEILFRLDECLTDLRDLFKCARDYRVPMDLSEDPEGMERVFLGELFKSGFFLIGDTFYNDMRDPNNTDLSADIINWASREIPSIDSKGSNIRVSRGVGPFKQKKMEECKFADLNVKLGCPYLYMHQGDCEHLFTISDIRYVNNDLKLQKTKFPYVTAASLCGKSEGLKCYMCKSRPPHWYTRQNNRLPVDPFFFCQNCFHSFNYDSNKKKIGQFRAYLYTGPHGIPESVNLNK